MKRTAFWMLSIVAIAGLLMSTTACSGKQEKEDEEPTAEKSAEKKEEKKEKKVVLYQYRFNPNSLTVTSGTTVKFLNKDQEKHNVKIAALDIDKNLEPGEEFTHEFGTSGEFAVENRLSEEQMKMSIVVE